MTNLCVTVIDYSMGNIWSVVSAFRYLGCKVKVSGTPNYIENADLLLLPGVGSFRKAMKSLEEKGLDHAIMEAVKVKEKKILGICLGMQLMGSHGTEDGNTIGLGLIANPVDKFTQNETGSYKIPHIGFDAVSSVPDSILFQGIPETADFYFVHSYRMLPDGLSGKSAICSYGIDFVAAYEQGNVFAAQFHPEKSQTNGLMLLKNFLEY